MRSHCRAVKGVISASLLLATLFSGRAESVLDDAVQLSAEGQTEPPQITLHWVPVQVPAQYSIARKSKENSTWDAPVPLPVTAISYTDTNVTAGSAYEYDLSCSTTNSISHGYIFAGIEAPLVEARGKIILVVDATQAASLAVELTRLQQDLVGDGWVVRRHDVPRMQVEADNTDPAAWNTRSNEVASLKGRIRADYLADPGNVRALLLFGHVPVPYSGALAPDGHPDHLGAWPADVYYADMEGTWTDSLVTSTEGIQIRNRNLPGDGKFDQSYLPGRAALQVGRVDLAKLPALPSSEVELLRQYLEKDHRYRQRIITAQPWGLIDDNFGILPGEAPAANAWANLAPLLGSDNLVIGRWLTDLTHDVFLWGYGCGAGTFTGAAAVADTAHFLVYDMKVVFTMLFGSFFGDWDSENNFLRAPLAAGPYTLSSAWTGRPFWYFHHLALGETIGYSTRLTQNNTALYQPLRLAPPAFSVGPIEDPTNSMAAVHIALMGDPTLRLHVVAPPSSLLAVTNASGGVDLSWEQPYDAPLGYHVYRAASASGPFARLTTSLVASNAFTDPVLTAERHYMVRAVKLEKSSSGTYYNPSQGAFARLPDNLSPSVPSLWAGGGSASWNINDVSGSAGSTPGWDLITLEDTLEVSATPSDPFTVRVSSSQPDNSPGPPANFASTNQYVWPILTASNTISGFAADKVNLVSTDFQGDLAGGTFSLALSEDAKSINLVFTPNHPPVAMPALFTRNWDMPLQVPVADFLAAFTNDPDGDPRALMQIGSSTNGTSIFTDNGSLLFVSTNNVAETVPFWVQDIRDYRSGDSIQAAASFIRIEPLPKPVEFTAHHAIEIEWQGELGKTYQVQFRLETPSQWINQGAPIPGTGERCSLFERTSEVTKFYRVVAVE